MSLYPSEDDELQLDQIDYLRNRYPGHVVGLSTHEYHDWSSSMMISYAKGARTWERHIDINYEKVPVANYCSLPEQCDVSVQGLPQGARNVRLGVGSSRRIISRKEHLPSISDALVRGVGAASDLLRWAMSSPRTISTRISISRSPAQGTVILPRGHQRGKLLQPIKADEQLTIDHIDGPYHENPGLKTPDPGAAGFDGKRMKRISETRSPTGWSRRASSRCLPSPAAGRCF